MLSTNRVYKQWDLFYKWWQIFRWHLRSTIKESREVVKDAWIKRRGYCPQSARPNFARDYRAFKDKWWNQDVYVEVFDRYDRDAAIWMFAVGYVANYDDDMFNSVWAFSNKRWFKINCVHSSNAWYYPLAILDCEPVNWYPWTTHWTFIPWERYTDNNWIIWYDANVFKRMKWLQYLERIRREREQMATEWEWIEWEWEMLLDEIPTPNR